MSKKPKKPTVADAAGFSSPVTITMQMHQPHSRRAIVKYIESVRKTNPELAAILAHCENGGDYREKAKSIKDLSDGMLIIK